MHEQIGHIDFSDEGIGELDAQGHIERQVSWCNIRGVSLRRGYVAASPVGLGFFGVVMLGIASLSARALMAHFRDGGYLQLKAAVGLVTLGPLGMWCMARAFKKGPLLMVQIKERSEKFALPKDFEQVDLAAILKARGFELKTDAY